MKRPSPLLFCLLVPLAACAASLDRSPAVEVSPPLSLTGSAYEAAARVELPATPPGELPGLHNIYALGERILSGSEPAGDEAFAELARRGVRTILSVDSKVPDAAAGARFGLRYVHVPIQYRGFTRDELLAIAKTFRELDGPFYVHCYHGKHRGPAAAAVGRVVLDGVPREQALAEMRQWCSTAATYEGLYADVATAAIPTAAETRAYAFDFAPAHTFTGLRAVMIELARKWDLVKAAASRGWTTDPAHPDVEPLQEATQVHQLFEAIAGLDEVAARPADFQTWLRKGRAGAEGLVRALSSCTQEEIGQEPWRAAADTAYRAVGASCTSCHGAYRN